MKKRLWNECSHPYSLWTLWLERNNQNFEDTQGDSADLWDKIEYWVLYGFPNLKDVLSFHFQIY